MSLSERTFQTFKSEDGTSLTSLRCHVCEETGEQFILWRDVQQAFDGVHYLEADDVSMAVFSVDNDGELYVELIRHDWVGSSCRSN